MTIKQTTAHQAARIFGSHGYTRVSTGVFVKPSADHDWQFWGAFSCDNPGCLVALGAISERINVYAMDALRRSVSYEIKHTVRPIVGPPIYLAEHGEFERATIEEKLPHTIEAFEAQWGNLSLNDWFDAAMKGSPYLQAQTILIPAYFKLCGRDLDLKEYCNRAIQCGATVELDKYYEFLANAE